VAKLRQLWQSSLPFRRVTAASLFFVTALLVYLGSHIPRSVSLPADELNARAMARVGEEQIVIRNPAIAEGDLALSSVSDGRWQGGELSILYRGGRTSEC
jgi:hypothetical protein